MNAAPRVGEIFEPRGVARHLFIGFIGLEEGNSIGDARCFLRGEVKKKAVVFSSKNVSKKADKNYIFYNREQELAGEFESSNLGCSGGKISRRRKVLIILGRDTKKLRARPGVKPSPSRGKEKMLFLLLPALSESPARNKKRQKTLLEMQRAISRHVPGPSFEGKGSHF